MSALAGHPYLSGQIVDTRIDATALGLVPLAVRTAGEGIPESRAGASTAYDRDQRSSRRYPRRRRVWPWRLGRFDGAERVFERVLPFERTDDQGVHPLRSVVHACEP
jgi:hypothetical protein